MGDSAYATVKKARIFVNKGVSLAFSARKTAGISRFKEAARSLMFMQKLLFRV